MGSTGAVEISRDAHEALERQISEAKAALKVHRAACERLEGIVVSVRQGAFGLAQRLQPFEELLAEGEGSEAGEGDDSDADSAVGGAGGAAGDGALPEPAVECISVLMRVERRLTRMLEMIAQTAPARASESEALSHSASVSSASAWGGPLVSADTLPAANNVRVKPLTQRSDGSTPRRADDDSDEEVSTRRPRSSAAAAAAAAAAARQTVLDRSTLKKMARTLHTSELRRREKEERAKKMQAKIALDLEKKETQMRIMGGDRDVPGFTFLTQKPDLL